MYTVGSKCSHSKINRKGETKIAFLPIDDVVYRCRICGKMVFKDLSEDMLYSYNTNNKFINNSYFKNDKDKIMIISEIDFNDFTDDINDIINIINKTLFSEYLNLSRTTLPFTIEIYKHKYINGIVIYIKFNTNDTTVTQLKNIDKSANILKEYLSYRYSNLIFENNTPYMNFRKSLKDEILRDAGRGLSDIFLGYPTDTFYYTIGLPDNTILRKCEM